MKIWDILIEIGFMATIVGLLIIIITLGCEKIDGRMAPPPQEGEIFLGRVQKIEYVYGKENSVNTLVTVGNKTYPVVGKCDIKGISMAWVYKKGPVKEYDVCTCHPNIRTYLRFVGFNKIVSTHVIEEF